MCRRRRPLAGPLRSVLRQSRHSFSLLACSACALRVATLHPSLTPFAAVLSAQFTPNPATHLSWGSTDFIHGSKVRSSLCTCIWLAVVVEWLLTAFHVSGRRFRRLSAKTTCSLLRCVSCRWCYLRCPLSHYAVLLSLLELQLIRLDVACARWTFRSRRWSQPAPGLSVRCPFPCSATARNTQLRLTTSFVHVLLPTTPSYQRLLILQFPMIKCGAPTECVASLCAVTTAADDSLTVLRDLGTMLTDPRLSDVVVRAGGVVRNNHLSCLLRCCSGRRLS